MTFIRNCYVAGRDRGFEIARTAIQENPIGFPLSYPIEDFDLDSEITEENSQEIWAAISWDIESHNRQFSPWELVAHAINSHPLASEGAWDAYEAGIYSGVNIALRVSQGGDNELPSRHMYDIPSDD